MTDPAVILLMLAPLALLHLSGRQVAQLEVFTLIESGLQAANPWGAWVLGIGLGIGFLWAVGRVTQLNLLWRGGAALIVLEGIGWALLLAPTLMVLTRWLPLTPAPLLIPDLATGLALPWFEFDGARIRGSLAVSAGAGLYEELFFRALLMGGGARLLRWLFRHFAAEVTSRRLSFLLALVLSSGLFAAAHGLHGNEAAFVPEILSFRVIAGLIFGLLFAFRGLAVCAYAHFAYDAIYLLS